MIFSRRLEHADKAWVRWLGIHAPSQKKYLETARVETAFKAGVHMGIGIAEDAAKEQS